MKKIMDSLRLLVLILVIFISSEAIAQGPPPPPPNGGNTGSNQNGGNAPIGGGLFILMGLGAVYGGRKIYQLYQDGVEKLEE